MLDLYRAGQLKLDELVTREYTLEEINEGYADMHAGCESARADPVLKRLPMSLITIAVILAAPLGIPAGVSAAHHAADRWRSFARWRRRIR